MTTRAEFEATCDSLAKQASDKGLLIEVGFLGYRKFFMSPEASIAQIAHARIAFFLGAQHLFRAMMSALDPDSEPTDADMDRMNKLDAELRTFEAQIAKLTAKGRA